jgi:arylsulfatase A-like enzyme
MKHFRLFLLALSLSGAASLFAADKPNVLFIAIDDLRPSLGSYGAPDVVTPNIDKLASQAVQFNRAYAQVATCGASRASLFSGLSPTKDRFTNYQSRIDEDAPGIATLPQVFKENGYTTLSIGKILHLPQDSAEVSWSEPPFRLHDKTHGAGRALLKETVGPFADGKEYGLDEQADVDDFAYGDGQFLKKALEELKRLKDSDKPFFLACGFMKPHLPFYAPKRYWDLYDRSELTLPANTSWPEDIPLSEWHIRKAQESRSFHSGGMDEWSEDYYRRLHHGYYACVSYIDSLVGRLLDELERLELADDTIVILWGDHGFQLGERSLTGKHNTFDVSLRVPVILRVPGSDSQGVRSEALFSSIDIFPTLVELAGLEKPDHLHGVSFADIATDPQAEFRDSVYCRFQRAATVFTRRYAYTRLDEGSEMLFDYQTDPDETVNVAGYPEYHDVLQQMRQLLDERIEQSLN